MKRFAAILCLVLGVWTCAGAMASARPYWYGGYGGYYGYRPYYRALLCPAPYYRPYGYAAPYRAYLSGPGDWIRLRLRVSGRLLLRLSGLLVLRRLWRRRLVRTWAAGTTETGRRTDLLQDKDSRGGARTRLRRPAPIVLWSASSLRSRPDGFFRAATWRFLHGIEQPPALVARC